MGTCRRGGRRLRFATILGLAAGLLAAFGVQGAWAAPGDLVAELHGDFATFGVSVAFDGQYLYYTNDNDPIIHRMTTQGVDAGVIFTDLPEGINAFSYDATRSTDSVSAFWAADGTGQVVWLIYVDKLTLTAVANPLDSFTVTGKLEGDCDNGSHVVGEVPQSACNLLVDGLAFDASETGGSIWYSPDASERVYHFGTDGTFLGYFDVNDPPGDMQPQCPPTPDRPRGNFSSGVGVGANVAYLTADGCDFFFSYAKSPTYLTPSDCLDKAFDCPGNRLAAFTYDGHRAEDLECDDVTFAPRDVMWVRDEQDPDFQFRAYELPTGTCSLGGGVSVSNGGANGTVSKGWMTGGGSVPATVPLGAQARHGFMLHCDPSQKPNQLEINWGNGNKFHLTQLGSSSCTKNPALPDNGRSFNTITGSGTGRYNGVGGATASWTFQDAGEPGTSDMGTLTVKDKNNNTVLVASGMLLTGPVPGSGNYRAHDGK